MLARAISTLSLDDCDGISAFLVEDAARGGLLALTTLAWLELGGEVGRIAQRLHVHPNTIRYRLKRAFTELGAIELGRSGTTHSGIVLLRLGISGVTAKR